MTKVKICGITREEDARFCAEMGVDFLGFIFAKSSPRYVEPEEALKLRSAATKSVGVFRDEKPETIRRIASLVKLDFVQLHGSETDDDIRAIGLPVIKAIRVEHTVPASTTAADWVMFDSGGGTGRAFDWSLLARHPHTKPFFLAGGLNPDNVEEAIRVVRPDAVDVSSGVESAPGVKDHDKIRQFMERVK